MAYLLLALWAAFLAMLYTRSFYAMTRWFRRSPLPRKTRPAVGALLTGVVALVLYFAFGRQADRAGRVSALATAPCNGHSRPTGTQTVALLLAIALGKILTTGLTIGSGGSAGVFGPSMVIGGCGGGALGLFFQRYWPAGGPVPTACVLVGMAGFFAAAAKTPISTLVMVSEMTGGYRCLLPALWVCVLAFMLSDKQSIYSSQVESRSRSPAHRGSFVRDVLAGRPRRTIDPARRTFSRLAPGDRWRVVVERFRAAIIRSCRWSMPKSGCWASSTWKKSAA